MSRTKVVTPSERDIENYGTQLLELDGWRSLKTDPVSDTSTVRLIVKALRDAHMFAAAELAGRFVRGKGFGELGMADRQYIRYRPEKAHWIQMPFPLNQGQLAEVLWIEWKRLKGKAADHQLNWIELERSRGALVWLADVDFVATPEHFYFHYKASGLMRKSISAPSGKA